MPQNKSIEFVTVEHDNGQVYIGTLVPVSETEFRVETGLRGRPIVIDQSDIVEVIPVNGRNPHVR